VTPISYHIAGSQEESLQDSSQEVRVLCLSDQEQHFAEAGSKHDVAIQVVQTVRELVDRLMAAPWNGIILEVRKHMRATQHEKAIVQDFVDSFPVLHVNTVQGQGPDQIKVMGCLDTFLGKVCRDFPPRSVRRAIRNRIHLPVFLAGEADPDFVQAEKSYTLDLSEGGVFVYTAGDWSRESWVRIRFVDLKDPAPVVGHIRWQRPWGVGLAMSGLGVKFGRISPEQHATICARFLLRESFEPPDVSDIQEALDDLLQDLGG